MLQRAVALDYQGSTLAPMATDSAMLYSQAFEALEAAVRNLELPWPQLPLLLKPCNNSTPTAAAAAPGASDKNNRMASFERLLAAELPQDWPAVAMPCLHLAAYLQYQLSHTYCLAAICTAELCLASNKAGQAVALAQLGSNLSEQLQDLGFKQAALLDPCSALGVRDSSRRLALQALLEQKAVQVLRR